MRKVRMLREYAASIAGQEINRNGKYVSQFVSAE